MKPSIRRFILGLGAALLVGGWGAMRYAHEQQQAFPGGDSTRRPRVWDRGASGLPLWLMEAVPSTGNKEDLLPPGSHLPASKRIYAAGVLGMALGAGLIGFAIPRPRDRSDGGRD